MQREPEDSAVRGRRKSTDTRMVGKLLVFCALMFAFGFAMIPMYDAFCEITGINNLVKSDRGAQAFARNTQIDRSRRIIVEFDANARGAWRFKPEVNALEVHPGELVTVVYDLVNTRDVETTGQAVPSYAPQQSAPYFRKLECFCFEQQALGAHEKKQFPVVFVIDPKLPRDVTTITLSYTFFEVAGRSRTVGAASRSGGDNG